MLNVLALVELGSASITERATIKTRIKSMWIRSLAKFVRGNIFHLPRVWVQRRTDGVLAPVSFAVRFLRRNLFEPLVQLGIRRDTKVRRLRLFLAATCRKGVCFA